MTTSPKKSESETKTVSATLQLNYDGNLIKHVKLSTLLSSFTRKKIDRIILQEIGKEYEIEEVVLMGNKWTINTSLSEVESYLKIDSYNCRYINDKCVLRESIQVKLVVQLKKRAKQDDWEILDSAFEEIGLKAPISSSNDETESDKFFEAPPTSDFSSSEASKPKGSSEKEKDSFNPIEELIKSLLNPLDKLLNNVTKHVTGSIESVTILKKLKGLLIKEDIVIDVQEILASKCLREFILDVCRNDISSKEDFKECFKSHLPYFLPEFGVFLQKHPSFLTLLPELLYFLTNTVTTKPKKQVNLPVHSYIECDGCISSLELKQTSEKAGFLQKNNWICGIRYKSAIVEDYDLCESCESTGLFEKEYAPFLKIGTPCKAPKQLFCVLEASKENQNQYKSKYQMKVDDLTATTATKSNPLVCFPYNVVRIKRKVLNSSYVKSWPEGTKLTCISETIDGVETRIMKNEEMSVVCLKPKERGIVEIKLYIDDKWQFTNKKYNYEAVWRLVSDSEGFGDEIKISLLVNV